MKSRNSYPTNAFYVGEVHVSYPFSRTTVEQKKELYKHIDLLEDGAIRAITRSEYDDPINHRYYDVLFTLFLRYGDKFISLHDEEVYAQEGMNLCKNLIPLTECLPKVDYNIPESLSTSDAKILFDRLFKKRKHDSFELLYPSNSKSLFHLNQFYVGNLSLYEGYYPDNKTLGKYEHRNLPQQYLLLNSDAAIICGFGQKSEAKDKLGQVYDYHEYTKFSCLFLNQGDSVLNLCDNQYYSRGILRKEHLSGIPIGISYYDWMIPYDEYLSEHEIRAEEDISVKDGLTLFKKRK